ncbi:membrane protein insertase YidC [Sulfurospirillum diekertiae]|uniref:Uncharacterized protein n=1 Tax=Sulfurospirillum diekertiae TaxID=1854492 RepID=A0A1Y0HIZ9_9BACT|nr:membrane protein insertase YidC [Sulfurospirillum diekertiae]ARU47243.1 hypothetical protein Sdiek1_0055 [Sulfurospirillum diekertiae]ASC92097.1 hypothetical protein Sdiek2_0054 [Sulfurospirillum diekertiae]
MLLPEQELSWLQDRAIDLMEEYKDLDEFYIDDERAYMERKAYLDEKKENLKGLFDSYYKRIERAKAYKEEYAARNSSPN